MTAAVIFLSILTTACIVFGRSDRDFIAKLDREEHPLKFLYPTASKIYSLICGLGGAEIFGGKEELREIYPDEQPQTVRKKQACHCIASVLAVTALTCMLVLLYGITVETHLTDGKYLYRNAAGGGKTGYELEYSRENRTETGKTTVWVDEVELTGENFEKLKAYVNDFIDCELPGGNESFDRITEPLKLITDIPGTSVKIEWKGDSRWLVSTDGSLRNSDIAVPVETEISAEISYFDKCWDYSRHITILPYEPGEEELFAGEMKQSLERQNKLNPEGEIYELPDVVAGEKLEWSEKKDSTPETILILGIVSAAVMLPAMKQEIKKKKKKRSEQMMKDYPDIVSKFVLLLTAGMTCRAAWTKICLDFVAECRKKEKESVNDGVLSGIFTKKRKKTIRYGYEEMLVSYRELQLGRPESSVYEDFGTRCGVASYQRFGTLLARNVRRGSTGILEMLEHETEEAFAQRRENVRRKGEEAGTKLLIPMFGMLMIVFAIVIVPAFSNL